MDNADKQGERKANEPFKIKGDWSKQSSALKDRFPQLTNDDLKFENGKESELFKRLETKLNKNRNEIIDVLKTNQEKISKIV